MRALIVDDERLARRGVVLRLSKFKDVEIVDECADGLSAVEKILELSADVIFLDIQMPGMYGFEVLRALPKENLPGVIFLTAYKQHALRAFEVHALDYLLKPVDDERFATAVDRARKLGDSAARIRTSERILRMLGRDSEKYTSRFVVRTGSRLQIVLSRGYRLDQRSGGLHGITRSRQVPPFARKHEFAGTKTRSSKVSPNPPLSNRVHGCDRGVVGHREPGICDPVD